MKNLAFLMISFLVGTCATSPAAAAESTVGWRGDGTGKYPAAQPSITWGRVSKAMRGLRYQAERPTEADPGAPMSDGVIREWLVLSPAPPGGKVEEETLPDEARLEPAAGEKIGE